MLIDALSVLCAQLTRDLLAIAKFLFYFFMCTQKLSTDLELRPLNHFDTRYINRRVLTQGSAFWGSEDNIFTSSPSKPPKTIFWAHIMESL